ncbi:MAG: CIA30 family protein [Cyanobacteria bacterium P01_F01_bin.42]
MTKTERWNFGRFIATLSFFGSIPIVSQVNTMIFGSTAPQPPQPVNNTLMNFVDGQGNPSGVWGALDDVVMGGVSQSNAKASAKGLLFTGYVSTDNSGGFVSIRTRNFEPPLNLSSNKGLALRLKGDGQRYKFFIRDSTGWDTLAYAMSFDTKVGEWMTVEIPFAELTAVKRAKTVDSAPSLRVNQIASLQLMLSKFEYNGVLNPSFKAGEFELTVASIELF